MHSSSLYCFYLLALFKVWRDTPSPCTLERLCADTGISSKTLSRAILELLDAGYIDRVRHITNTAKRPSYAYWVTQDGFNHLKDNKIFSQKVINEIRYIEHLRYRPNIAIPEKTKKLPISARLLLTFLVSRQVSNGYTLPFSQADTKKSLKMSSGKYKSALNTLLQEKVVRWYLPGFKSGVLIGTESSLVRLNNTLTNELQGQSQSISSLSLVGAREELGLIDLLFEDIATRYQGNSTSQKLSERSSSVTTFYHNVAKDYRRAPQIVTHLKMELISLIEIYMCLPSGQNTKELKKQLLKYLIASPEKEKVWLEAYEALTDQLLRAITPLTTRITSTIAQFEDAFTESHEILLTIENPNHMELAIKVCHKQS